MLLIDNWVLQDVGECLVSGLAPEESSVISIDQDNNSHIILDVPFSGVQIEALLELLVNIVLRDSLYIDSGFIETWAEHEPVFTPLLKSGLVRGIPFPVEDNALIEARKLSVERLCVTDSLLEEQARNEQSWSAGKGVVNPYMSAVLWGTAGMLARSHVYEAPYSGHPLRKRVIEQTLFASPSRDIVSETQDWLTDKRIHLFETVTANGSERMASITLPPVAIDVIEEANDISQLIPVAYQLRDKYSKMREWLKYVQEAIDTEDPKGIVKYKKTLNAVSRDLDREMGKTESGKVSLQIGIGWPNLSIELGTLDHVVKRFGMRAMINNQILSPKGEKSVKKLLRLFDEEKSSIGQSAMSYLQMRRNS